MNNGIYISPTEFVSFAQQGPGPMADQIATRAAAGDLSSFFGLLPNPDPVLKKMGADIKVYRDLMADPLVKGARTRRGDSVLALERGIDEEQSVGTPARVRKAVEAMLQRLDIQRIVRDQVDGAFFGYRVSEIMWGTVDGIPAPVDLIAKPCEWFGFGAEDNELRFRRRGSMTGEPVPARKFVVVGKMRGWENPYGEPDLAPCFWPVVFKRGGLKFWMTFTEKYGMPWAVGKLPRTAQPKEHEDLADKLFAMVRDAVATIPDDSSVEMITVASSANADIYERLIMMCRGEISIALLGNNQSVEMQSNKASADAAQHVEKFLRDADAQMVAAGFNDLVRNFCEVNFPGAKPPVYAFWEQESVDDAQASRDQKLQQAGARLTPAYFKRAYKLQDGDIDETPPPDPAAQPAGGAPRLRLVKPGAVNDTASFADDQVPADQAAVDAAIAQLPAQEIEAAMRELLAPALRAIQEAATPDDVRQALADAWPEMDTSRLEKLMEQAYFVADLVGRDGVRQEAA